MQIHELDNYSGSLGSGAYIAVDNGTDTGKASISQVTDPLNSRIDNIIAGPSSSAQEVIDARLGADGVTYPSLGDAIRDQVGDLKSDFNSLNHFVRYESEVINEKKIIQTTSGTKIDATNSRFPVSIARDTSFRFRVDGAGLINKYALYCNNGSNAERFGTNLIPGITYDFTAMTDATSLYIYVGATDVVGTGILTLSAIDVIINDDSLEKHITAIEDIVEELQPLAGNKWALDASEFTELCIHHDNFSRTMAGFEIGMNSGGTDIGNNYDWVTPNDYNDGLTVNNGATFTAGARTYNYSLRKIAAVNADNFMVETNTPVVNYPIMLGFNVTDINNFTVLELRKNTAGYKISVNVIRNGITAKTLMDKQVNQILAQVANIYVVRGVLYLKLDDQICASEYIGECGDHVYLASYKSYNTHFDFINVFSLVSKVTWNPNPTLDAGISDIPLKAVSANEGNYELQDLVTRWSNYADHFVLHSDDELIHNGRRSEISISNMDMFKRNLRTFRVSFDVLFPTEYVDTQREDLFVQFHDRDGTYRGTVPFALYIKDHTINVNISSTLKPKDDNTSVIIDLHRFDFCDVELGKWHHVEIECKERYETRQNPYLRILIDGKTEFEYRKANCYNDLLGTSPQYGIYKNNWGTGVTEFQRYFDNFKIEYC